MMMKHMLLTILLLFCILAVSAQKASPKRTTWVPDTSINVSLKLLDPASVREKLGDQHGKLTEDEGPDRIQLANRNRTEYLILYHSYGSNANAFSEFEIGILPGGSGSFRTTSFSTFKTRRSIRLGMKLDSLFDIRGKEDTIYIHSGYTVLHYETTDLHFGNGILGRYNMPSYEESYYFKEGRLVKYLFGFPNP
jgi:hypothetical protein